VAKGLELYQKIDDVPEPTFSTSYPMKVKQRINLLASLLHQLKLRIQNIKNEIILNQRTVISSNLHLAYPYQYNNGNSS